MIAKAMRATIPAAAIRRRGSGVPAPLLTAGHRPSDTAGAR